MNNPRLIITPFAESGDKSTIPESIGTLSNSATWQAGFPPVTMTNKASGGLAPRGQDVNGVLYDITSNLKHLQSGGAYQFDSTYAAEIGGYQEGALVYNQDQTAMYQSLIDGNISPLSMSTRWKTVWRSSLLSDIDGKIDITSIVQNTGSSKSSVMSQKATTDAINALRNTASLATNGWHKDTVTGMITQWGAYAGNIGAGTYTANLPIPFPNQFLFIMGWLSDAISYQIDSASNSAGKNGSSLSTFRVTYDIGIPTSWIAFGR